MGVSRASIESCYRRYAPMVFRRARGLVESDADAHEIVQDVFLSLFERPDQFAGKSTLTTFLYSATTHACLNRLHKNKNRLRLIAERVAPALHASSTVPSPDRLYHLQQLLVRMPESLARVLVYTHLDEFSHDEVARLLGCSRRQVGKLLERAAAWIRDQEEQTC